jgi:hypothetical protein
MAVCIVTLVYVLASCAAHRRIRAVPVCVAILVEQFFL